MCLSGAAALVPLSVSDATPDYTNVFGIGMGLNLNSNGGAAMPYDATSHGVTGFSFTITGVPSSGVQVEFPIPATDSTGNSWMFPVTADGSYTVVLAADLLQASGATEPPFDPSKIEAIKFHVPTNSTAAVPVDNLCVRSLCAEQRPR